VTPKRRALLSWPRATNRARFTGRSAYRGVDLVDLGTADIVVGPVMAHGNALRFVG
jgi:hypothetical protein